MEPTYRKGLTVGEVKGRRFKVYEPIKKYNFVDKIIVQFKKGKSNEPNTGNRSGDIYKPE